ncbi:hypothetical protein E2C01_033872 [Portunus trituberculatus]|uniref:Uncharacterized protein n=1 Tax=Portunus trituberculatus TaxID=210409 RepID=A0A5B7F4M3_PORTR|nr:hypothetical protein [Portunus trituberculatus]
MGLEWQGEVSCLPISASMDRVRTQHLLASLRVCNPHYSKFSIHISTGTKRTSTTTTNATRDEKQYRVSLDYDGLNFC